MEKRECIDCGRTLVDQVRGRPALRCGECKRGRRRIKERAPVTCADCGVVFAPPGHTGLPPERCEPCRTERRRQTNVAKARSWREANPEKQRAHSRKSHEKRQQRPEWREYRNEAHMRHKYGITMADFEALLAKQGGVCAICAGEHRGVGKRLHIDHCHESGKIRGLLCSPCNTAIGLLDDDPARAESAAAYLRR